MGVLITKFTFSFLQINLNIYIRIHKDDYITCVHIYILMYSIQINLQKRESEFV
jgi:hypothetical protein